MKKIRIMLTTIGMLAVVGGALAFKTRTFGNKSYCTSTDRNAVWCSLSTPSRTIMEGAAFAYTMVPNGFVCTLNTRCSKMGSGLEQ